MRVMYDRGWRWEDGKNNLSMYKYAIRVVRLSHGCFGTQISFEYGYSLTYSMKACILSSPSVFDIAWISRRPNQINYEWSRSIRVLPPVIG